MNDIEVTSIDLVEGGNVFKQGHYLTLGYVPRDENGDTVDLSGKTLTVSIWGRKGVVFEAPATYSAGVIRFTLNETVPAADDYKVEFTATLSTDSTYRKKFPANSNTARIAIKQSADDLGNAGISVYTVAQFQQLFDQAAGALTEDSEVILARDGEALLGTRLAKDKQEVIAQLAEKAIKSEVRLKTDSVGLNDADAEMLAAIEGGQGATFNLLSIPREGSVGVKETTFAKSGKNIWDGKIVENASLSGAVPNGTYGTLAGARTVILKVPKLSTVTISRTAGSSDRFRLGVKAGVPTPGGTLRYILANDPGGTITTTLQGDEDHLFIYVSSVSTGFPQEFQIEFGNVKTDYVSHEMVSIKLTKESGASLGFLEDKNKVIETRHLQENSVTPTIASFVNPGKNLFNGIYTLDRSITGSSTADGKFASSTSKAVSVIFKGEPGEDYVFSRILGSTTRFRVATFKSLPNVGDSVNRYIMANDIGSTIKVTLQPDENYIVAFVSLNEDYKKPENFMIERGTRKTDYESPDRITMDFSVAQEFGSQKKSFYLTDVINENYENTQPYLSASSNDVSQLYAYIDAIMAEYPEFITRKLWGNDASGLPIYEYKASPKNPQLGTEIDSHDIPNIVINCGTHGFEKQAIWGAVKFFEDMARNWRSGGVLNAVRWNVQITFIPCLNPSGYNLHTRKNGNGVDLNRNQTAGWGTGDTDPTSEYYRGPSPASEIETQLMEAFIEQLKEENKTVFFIDWHNSGGYLSQGHVIWGSSNSEDVRKTVSGFLNFMESKAKRDFSYIDENANLRYLSVPLGGGVAYTAHKAGIDSMLLETAVQFDTLTDTQKFNTESIGNLMISLLRAYS